MIKRRGKDRRELTSTKSLANGTMEVVSVRGVDGMAAVVLESPHLITGLPDARTESCGGLATAESLRSSRSEFGSCFSRDTRGRIRRRT